MEHIAAFRINSFAKYLDHDKYKISVFTLGSKDEQEEVFGCTVHRVACRSILQRRDQRSSDNSLIHNVKSINNLLVENVFKSERPGWRGRVVEQLKKLDKVRAIDLVISSYSPIDAHEVGLAFKKYRPNVKWILDMRDEMSMRPTKGKRVREWLRKKELEYSKRADAVISVSRPILKDFISIMKNDSILFREIRNGFDHDEKPAQNFNSVFKILYAGTFYGNIKPDKFFKALTDLKSRGLLPSDWSLELLGTHRNFKVPDEIENHMHYSPRVDNLSAVKVMMSSDCLLLIHPVSSRKGVYTGKLFDYISVKKPILALVDETDVAADLIRETNAGVVANFDDIEAVQKAFLKVYSIWKNRHTLDHDEKKIQKLHRRYQVALLEKLIDEVLVTS